MQKKCECGNFFEVEQELHIIVLGHPTKIATINRCASCVTKYANKFSTKCVVCERPILPGTPVGNGIVGEYGTGVAHLEIGHFNCATAATFAGTWGEGKIVPHPALITR
ncbi:MAG: hypothetical protein M1429_02165 [Patescibacteria group bacterium]|nr:hypothetical protein [Patescibacteria group bacterium]